MNTKKELTGVLLVGGDSRRMGQNKALLEINGKSLIQRNLEILEGLCSQVLISSRREEPYSRFGYPVVIDTFPNTGPLGGLYSALKVADQEYLFLVACDMPCLHPDAILRLYNQRENYDVILPSLGGKVHPLHGIYHKRILPIVEEQLIQGRLKVLEILGTLHTRIIQVEKELAPEDVSSFQMSLINTNTPEEWGEVVKSAKPMDGN